ncbi:MAG: transposase [Dechloromonas sp.]|nr:transposase [Candidatus Dechloromonas phosphoritropha]
MTEELRGASCSKSMVSALCAGLELRVSAFNERRLDGEYPFVLVDAPFIKSRQEDRVVSRAVLTVSGIRADGFREILGVRIGDTESFATWDETFRWLRGRGLKGTQFIISDDHGGLREAAARHFQGASWQRCQASDAQIFWANATPATAPRWQFRRQALCCRRPIWSRAKRRLAEFTERFAKSAPKAVACLEAGFEDAMAVMVLPEKYRKRLRTTNMQERLNEEIRRRERVIRIFPNDESALRLIGACWPNRTRLGRKRKYSSDMDES